MKRHFQKFRDPRFALTTLQNPYLERPHPRRTRPGRATRARMAAHRRRIAAPQPLAPRHAPDSIPVSELPAALELPEELPAEFT